MTDQATAPAQAQTETQEPEFHTEEWLFLRHGEARGGGQTAVFESLATGEQHSFRCPPRHVTRGYRPGGCYRVEVSADGQSARFLESYRAVTRQHPERGMELTVAAKARDLARAAARRHETAGLADVLECLEPIRRLYRETSPMARAALEVAVLGYVKGYGNVDKARR
jgi:hypothetical protein